MLRGLAEADIRLGLEICNRYETNVVNTVRDALDLADDIGCDNVRVHLDTYHMNIEEADFVRPVHEAGARLGDLAIWRDMWDDGRDLAIHARAFIENGLTAARRRR